MKKKMVVLAAAILFASVSVFASGSGDTASTPPAAVKKLAFYAWTNPANMVPLLEAFNKQYAGKYEMVLPEIGRRQNHDDQHGPFLGRAGRRHDTVQRLRSSPARRQRRLSGVEEIFR